MSRQWLDFFRAHAPHYDENGFAQNTVAEIDFLLTLFPLPRGASILDVGCGTGRHSIELAKRGYKVTGLDLTDAMLDVARRKAAAAQVAVNWIEGDATDPAHFEGKYDAALCLCEGAVGLIEHGEDPEEHDLTIFQNISKVLKPGGGFLLTALNGYRPIREMKDEHIRDGQFDPATMVSNYIDVMDLREGQRTVRIYERLFIPPEMVRLLRQAGFAVDAVWGGTAGHWGQRPVSFDDIEAMYVCRKS